MKKILLGVILLTFLVVGSYWVYLIVKPQPEIVGGPVVSWETFTTELEAEQAMLLAKYGDYIQVTEDGRLMYKDRVINENRFKNKIPANTVVHVYDGPDGKGFQIIQREGNIERAYAIGAEAAARTYVTTFDTASTTP